MPTSITLCLVVTITALWPAAVEARIERDRAQVRAFRSENPCPVTGASKGPCPGYVIDHIKALACGGADAYSNMQ